MIGPSPHQRAVSVAAKALMFAALALLGGVGTVYAPVPTFAAVAVAFLVSLWLFARGGLPSLTRTGATKEDATAGGADKDKPRSTLTTKLVSGYLLLWWLILIAPIVAYSPRGGGAAAQAAAQGSLQRQVLIFSFGLVGAYFLPAAIRRFDPAFRWVVALWTLHLCWALTSLAWSIYPPLTFRNVVAFALVSVGSFGLGAGFYASRPNGRDLFLRHIFIGGILSALVVLGPLPFRWGQYAFLSASDRLSIGGDFPTYVVRPVICALLILVVTTILGVREWRRRDWFWVVVLVIPLLVLKARGPVLWALLALGIFYLFYRVRVQDRMLQTGSLLVLGLGAYVGYSAGILDPLVLYLSRGDVEYTMTLSNRVPLWEVLVAEFAQHPLIGVGFAAFWSPDNLFRIEQIVGWEVVSVHNGFLEELLNVGLVGFSLLLGFFISALVVVGRRIRQGDPFGWLAFVFLIYFLLSNLTNSLFTEFLEVPLIIILAMLGLMAGSKPEVGVPPGRIATPRRSSSGRSRANAGRNPM